MEARVLRRLLKSLGANFYGQGITVVVQLLGVPILLHAWGVQLYGEWLILVAIPIYLSMTDLGFSQSAGNDMTQKVARGERTQALAVFQTLLALIVSTSFLMLLIASVLVYVLPFEQWLSFSMINTMEARWVIWIMLVEVLLHLFEGINHAGYRANGEYALHMAVHSTTLLVQSIAIWITALSGGGPVAAAISYLCVRLLATPLSAAYLVRCHGWLKFGLTRARKSELRRLARPAIANVAMPLAQAFNIQGMVLVTGALLGPVAVVCFTTLRTLTRLTLQMVLTVSNASEPELATAFGLGNSNLLQRLFVSSMRAGLWLALFTTIFLILFGGWIIQRWTRGSFVINYPLFYWLISSSLISVLWISALSMLKAANQHLRSSLIYCVAAVTTVLLAGAFLAFTGELADVGFYLVILDVIMVFFTLPAASALANISIKSILIQVIDPSPLIRLISRRPRVH